MDTPVAYLICRCKACTSTYTTGENLQQPFSPHSLIFDDCTISTQHCIRHIISICPNRPALYYLHESPDLTLAEHHMFDAFQKLGCTIQAMLCSDFGKTSYTRQRRHKRFLAQTDYLLVAFDKPLAEINNAIRTADIQHTPVIRFQPH